MKATPQEQADLLVLAEIDSELARLRRAVDAATDSTTSQPLRVEQREFASKLIDARSHLEGLQLEAKRAQEDLDVVEQRIAKDKQLLTATSSTKDAQGIQHELATLERRKSELEDAQIALLDLIEQAEQANLAVAAQKADVDARLSAATSQAEAELVKARSGLDLVAAKRAQHCASMNQDLVEFYEKKAKRGVVAARLLGRECGACHMTIGATALAEIAELAADEIASCTECQAVLIR